MGSFIVIYSVKLLDYQQWHSGVCWTETETYLTLILHELYATTDRWGHQLIVLVFPRFVGSYCMLD